MDDDDSAGLDVNPLSRLAEQHREGAAKRDEDLLLIRVEVPAAGGVCGIGPHPGARLGHLRGLGEGCGAPRLLTLVTGALLPGEVIEVDDVPAHGPTIPSGPMAEPRPAALPPAERTV